MASSLLHNKLKKLRKTHSAKHPSNRVAYGRIREETIRMEWMKEKASNTAALAEAGAEKAKATVGEKVDKMKASNEFDKDMATQQKEDRKADAELRKQEAHVHNAQQKEPTTFSQTGL